MKALLSVFNKTDLVEFAGSIHKLGYDLVSTGGTHRELSEAGLPVQQVADMTGSPEMLDGRVKTLHPKVHGGILARRNLPRDMTQLAEYGIDTIDLVVSNLYPFRETVEKDSVTLEEALENIDIGGPALIRASAKNFPHVVVVVDPADYEWVLDKLSGSGLSMEDRQGLARKAFQHVALYDTAVSQYLSRDGASSFPDELTIGLNKRLDLRYGENPHQKGAFYTLDSGPVDGIGGFVQHHGKEMSFVNILDADAAFNLVADFSEPAVAIIKHTNPCCFATGDGNVADLYEKALTQGDPVSAYGGIVASNRPIDMAYAKALREVRSPVNGGRMFYEIIVAPGAEPEALEHLKKKSKDLRILTVPPRDARLPRREVRTVRGGALVQEADVTVSGETAFRVVTKRQPSAPESADMSVAWAVCKHVKSNAITIVKDGVLVGMGAGQPNRVTSVRLASQFAGERSKGAVLASDALFPFDDNVVEGARAGIGAIVQPGGSIRDEEIITTADRLEIAMVFAGVRHFLH